MGAPLVVAAGVYVAAARIEAMSDAPCLRSDAGAAGRLPAWRRPAHLAVRALLRRLLAEVAEAAAGAALAARERGQPYLVGQPDVAVSLSHTEGWVAAAVRTGGGRVGADVQAPGPASTGLVRRCCTAAAQVELARLAEPARERELAWIWSVQEACVKATGAGLAGRPWTIPVTPGQHTGRWRGVRWTALRAGFPVPVSCAVEESPVTTGVVTESP